MATQKEQLTQQIKDTYAKGIASGKTREEIIGAMKNQLQTTGQYDTVKQIVTGTPAQLTQTQDQLKQKIATGNFSASEARQYNQMTGNQQGARELALTSKQGVKNLQTTITPEEAGKMSQAGITNVGQGVKPDMTAGTKEEFKQAIDNQGYTIKNGVASDGKAHLEGTNYQDLINQGYTKEQIQDAINKGVTLPGQKVKYPGGFGTENKTGGTTTTDITYQEDKIPYDANKVISKAPQFTGADGKTYQTVRNSDNTLTTIDVTTGQPVTGKYTDAERDSIKQGFLKSPEQVQQETKQNIQIDPNNLFNSIRTGQSVNQEIKNSAEYKRQQDRANRLSKFENMSAPDLAYAMTNGKLFIGTETYNDLKQINPALVKQAEQLMSLNSALSTKKTSVEETRENIAKTILDKMTDTEITDFKGIISQNKEVVSLNNKLAETKNELDTLKESIDYMEDDLTKQLSGTGATRGYIQAKASRMNRDLIREYNAKLNEYNTTAGQLQTITENIKYELGLEDQRKAKELQSLQFAYGIASDELGYQRGLEAEQRQREQQLEDRAYSRDLQLEDRAYNEALQTRQLEQKYAYEYGDLNSNNATLQNIAIERAVASMYENYPIPGMESQSVKVQKVKNLMAQGMTGTQAIAQVENEIRNSQRYKDYLASQAPTSKTQTPIKMGEDSLYDPNTGTWITKPTATSGFTITQNYGATSPNAKDNVKLANGQVGTPGVDLSMPINTPIITGISGEVTFVGKKGDYGNQVIITDEQGNQHMYSHLNTANVKVGDKVTSGQNIALSGNTGFSTGPHLDYRVKGSDGQWQDPNMYSGIGQVETTGGQTTTFSQQVKDWGDNIMNGIGGAKITSIKDDNLRSQVSSYIAEKTKKQPNQNIATIYGVLDVLKELENHPGLNSAVGSFGFGASYIPGTDAKGFLAKLSQLEGKQFLEGIQQMKGMGALSNAEGSKVAAAASSLLDTSQSEKSWKAELKKVKSLLEGKISTTEEDAGIKFDIYGRPVNNTDTTGTSTQYGGKVYNFNPEG